MLQKRIGIKRKERPHSTLIFLWDHFLVNESLIQQEPLPRILNSGMFVLEKIILNDNFSRVFLDGNDNIGWFQSLRVLVKLNAKASELWQKYLQKVSFILKQTIVNWEF